MPRREDPRLITGRGRYAGDVSPAGLTHLVFLRSHLPHATISSIDVEAARAMPGVLAVWTADDLPATMRELVEWVPRGITGKPRPVLAHGEVNYVGEAVAAVVAETAYQAQDAVQVVFADLEPLAGVATISAAMAAGAPRVHADLESNLAGTYSRSHGDIEAAFDSTAVIVAEKLSAARICGAAMEPRSVTVEPVDGRLRVWTSTQYVFGVRDRIATCLTMEKDQVEVLAEDVGGGFGPKATVYPEEVFTAFAARTLGRPVRWVATRSEDTATTVHAHGSSFEIELAANPDGTLRGLRGTMWHDVGAFQAAGVAQPGLVIAHLLSAYRLPALSVEARLVMTNSASTGFVRGGGRPLGNFVIERLMDRLAAAVGVDAAEIRRRNFVQPDQMPYDTGYPAGKENVVYDSGDYPRLLQMALEALGHDELRARQAADGGRPIGIGIACCVESSGFGTESARIRVESNGVAHLFIGSTPQGQSHLTTAAQVASDRLNWPLERVQVTAGDTRVLAFGEMTAGSRTAVQVGNASSLAAQAARRWLLEHAAEKLEADPRDLVMEEGVISVRGTPSSSIDATELLPPEGIEFTESFQPVLPNAYSSGCHAAAVQVDPETGAVEILAYAIAHDTGVAINPLVVAGQIQGGYVHGLGFALFEEAIYQPDGGFQSASFLDYTMASAPEARVAPTVVSFHTETPHNPEGFKGAGESGTVPVPAAIANAVEEAVRRINPSARIVDLPITPQRVFDAVRGAATEPAS